MNKPLKITIVVGEYCFEVRSAENQCCRAFKYNLVSMFY